MSKLLEPSKLFVEFKRRFLIGGVCFFRRFEVAEFVGLSVHHDPRAPLFPEGTYALISTSVVFVALHVTAILRVTGWAKVSPPHVPAVSAFMVNAIIRPDALHNEISDSVRSVTRPVYADDSVSIPITGFLTSSNGTGFGPAGLIHLPSQDACERVVVQDTPHVFGREVVARVCVACDRLISHLVMPLTRWSGPGEGVSSAFPVPHYAICGMIGQR